MKKEEKETEIIWVDGEPLINLGEKQPRFHVVHYTAMSPFQAMMDDMMKFMRDMGLEDADKKE